MLSRPQGGRGRAARGLTTDRTGHAGPRLRPTAPCTRRAASSPIISGRARGRRGGRTAVPAHPQRRAWKVPSPPPPCAARRGHRRRSFRIRCSSGASLRGLKAFGSGTLKVSSTARAGAQGTRLRRAERRRGWAWASRPNRGSSGLCGRPRHAEPRSRGGDTCGCRAMPITDSGRSRSPGNDGLRVTDRNVRRHPSPRPKFGAMRSISSLCHPSINHVFIHETASRNGTEGTER